MKKMFLAVLWVVLFCGVALFTGCGVGTYVPAEVQMELNRTEIVIQEMLDVIGDLKIYTYGNKAEKNFNSYSDEQLYQLHSKVNSAIKSSELKAQTARNRGDVNSWARLSRDLQDYKYRLEAEMRKRGLQVPY